jgi:copper homeostasis protein (lipoprotein)
MKARHPVRTLAIALGFLVSVHGTAAAQIRGTATYRERMTLPADAVFDATLEDVSRTGEPSTVIGRARIRGPKNPPIKFQIPFDASRIVPGRRYVVRARILSGTRPLFTTDQSYPVLTGGNGRQVSLVLHRTATGDEITPTPSERVAVAPTSGSAIFTGDLPCTDCRSVRYQLELFPDRTFYLRRTYVGRPRSTPSDEIGTWVLSRDGRTLTLTRDVEPPLRIAIGATNTLHVLGESGESASGARSDVLRLAPGASPLEPRVRLRGMYRNVADAGRFTECVTRQSWPVAQERDNLALEAAYARARRSPGEAVLVEVTGRVAMRPGADGGDSERTLVVERFGGAQPGENCESSGAAVSENTRPTSPDEGRAASPLENTHWTLTRVGDTPVRHEGEREPHIVLHSTTRRVSGAAICNQILGSYRVQGTSLTFGTVATSRMMCPSGMDIERRFLAALQATRTARVRGSTLDLLDASRRVVASFEAKYGNDER